MSNNYKYKKLIKFIHITYIPRVKSQRRYFIPLSLNNIFDQIRKYIQICGGPLAKYEHFLKVIFIYKLIIQYILWIRHSGVYKLCKNMWKNAKLSHKARCETQRSLPSSYVQEFMWRQLFGKNPFINIIEILHWDILWIN